MAFLAGCADSLSSKGDVPDGAAGSGTPTSEADLARAASSFTSSATPGSTSYKVGPLDILDITVFKVPELSRSAQVADNGIINLPLVGDVKALGRTSRDIERDIAARLGAKYLNSPQVSVFVKEYNSQRTTIEGAVKKPGVYPLKGRTTLLQIIAQAEGLDRESASSTVLVFRQGEGQKSAARFDVEEIRAGKSQDPEVVAGDVIVAESSSSKLAFSYVVKALPAASLFRVF